MAVERVDDPTTSIYQPQIRQSDHVRFQRRSDRQTGPSEPLWSQGLMGPPFFRKKDQKIDQLRTPWSQRTMSSPFLTQKYPNWNPIVFYAKRSKYRPNLKPMVPRAHLSSDLSYTKFGNSWSQGPMGLPILRKTEEKLHNFFDMLLGLQGSVLLS